MTKPPDLIRLPRHLAIIMDGNGRWAKRRGLPRIIGHRQGVKAVHSTVRLCRELDIPVLTLYAFSQENWGRPRAEVSALMDLLYDNLKSELDEMLGNQISLRAIGQIERLPERVRTCLLNTIERTSSNTAMILNLALSYGGRAEIVGAARRLAKRCLSGTLDPEDIDEAVFASNLDTAGLPDPDLLIRTSGENRLSNFLLFQTAYSEFYITPTLWPDFDEDELLKALFEYQKRERRFGLTDEQHSESCTA
ncbi:MAG: isoprenyl transferase [Deltaproteobacteria bacterium]|nr:MAG: isoprenyl transferase [Deltaproteobacteria bacterium]RKX56769.1 MAG: isoprenyl transferase [Thermodesulfobacteriota bacterium]